MGVFSAPRPGRFTPGKGRGTNCTIDWVDPRAGLDVCGKSRPSNRGSLLGPSSPERVAIPAELPRPTGRRDGRKIFLLVKFKINEHKGRIWIGNLVPSEWQIVYLKICTYSNVCCSFCIWSVLCWCLYVDCVMTTSVLQDYLGGEINFDNVTPY